MPESDTHYGASWWIGGAIIFLILLAMPLVFFVALIILIPIGLALYFMNK